MPACAYRRETGGRERARREGEGDRKKVDELREGRRRDVGGEEQNERWLMNYTVSMIHTFFWGENVGGERRKMADELYGRNDSRLNGQIN